MTQHKWTRRALMSGIGAGALQLTVAQPAVAQTPDVPFKPVRHPQDAWINSLPGGHRTIIDSVSPRGVGEALLFARNLFVANGSGYGLKDADVAVIVCLRHAGTGFAFNDAMWAKYGAQLAGSPDFTDPKTKRTPTTNLYNAADFGLGITIGAVTARGMQFAVCSMATQRLSGQIATANGLAADAVFKELTSNLVPNSHMVAAGVVAVTRAQEYGYTFLNAG
jgi:intracellular sulfur oxidation DsrE/DsrF family protein